MLYLGHPLKSTLEIVQWNSMKMMWGICLTKTESPLLQSVLIKMDKKCKYVMLFIIYFILSSEFWARQAERKVVKIKNLYFSYWAWSTPWGHDLSLKTFCGNPALSWAIRYSVFQPVKFTSSFEFMCGTLFSTFWNLMVNIGYITWF